MKNETWKSIVGYEGLYEVSDFGRVRSLQSGRWHNRQKILKPRDNGYGYLQVILCRDGIHKHMRVHRLVAEAFVPNPNNLETVNHRDENKHNNSSSNLEWMTRGDNKRYSANKPVQMFDKSTNELLAEFPSIMEAKRVTEIHQGHICSCCHGKLNTAGGFKWRFNEGQSHV